MIKFNIVLFHFGKYNENNINYAKEHPLFLECYNSLLKEFKNDNIIVFHSFEEIFEQYPKIKKIIDLKYKSFFYNENIYFPYKIDFIRILLTLFIDNLLYFDSDILIMQGYRHLLENAINSQPLQKFFYNTTATFITTSIFYCKSFFSDIFNILDTFNNEYIGDNQSLIDAHFNENEKIGFIPAKNTIHYANLRELKNLSNIKYINNIEQAYLSDDIWFYNEAQKEVYYKGNDFIVYPLFDNFTIDDFLTEVKFS